MAASQQFCELYMLGQADGRRTDAVFSLEKEMRCAHQTHVAGARMEQVAAEEQRQDELRRLAGSWFT